MAADTCTSEKRGTQVSGGPWQQDNILLFFIFQCNVNKGGDGRTDKEINHARDEREREGEIVWLR